jgi:hypothetical protein
VAEKPNKIQIKIKIKIQTKNKYEQFKTYALWNSCFVSLLPVNRLID